MYERMRLVWTLMSALGSVLLCIVIYVILHSNPGDVPRLMAIAAAVTIGIPLAAFAVVTVARKVDKDR
jgi:hypothetical protein